MTAPLDRLVGRPPAARAFSRVRLVAAIVLVVLGLGVGPSEGSVLPTPWTTVLLVGSAALLLGTDRLVTAALRVRGARHGRIALVGTGVDALVVLAAIWVAGPPPRSPVVVLLLLPLVGAALSGGIAALGIAWVGCSLLLAVQQFVGPGGLDLVALRASAVVLPILLLTALPIAVLGEQLVSAVARAQAAGAEADERTRLLTAVVTACADQTRPDVEGVLSSLVAGAVSLGATSAQVTGGGVALPGGTGNAPELVRELTDAADGPRLALTFQAPGPDAMVVEAVDLLVAQARVAYARAELLADGPAVRPPAGSPWSDDLVSAR